ncbi:MAG: cupredoxin domain-containing protein [Chloroflexi bacterium]|nr:cupredoxin domain-containing protein [Chloroflexota bacterium]
MKKTRLFCGTMLLVMVMVMVLMALASCARASSPLPIPASPSTQPLEPAPTNGPAVTINLTAKNLLFDKKTISVPAGARVTLNLTNNESFVSHNFALYETSATLNVIYKGAFVSGGKSQDFEFSAPSTPGTYYFRCDIHSITMSGDFIVTEPE